MVQAVAKFEKVSLEQYLKDVKSAVEKSGKMFTKVDADKYAEKWKSIQLPKRSTALAAGYDFYLPNKVHVSPMEITRIPTGIRCKIEPGWFLALIPRSGLGTKYGFRLLNTFGCVDADYFEADNEGHIQAFVTCDADLTINTGDRYVQGIFFPYGTTTDDQATGSRHGGFGSTGTK